MNWEAIAGNLTQVLLAVGGWEGIQYLLNRFYFDKKKNKNEEEGGLIQNVTGQVKILLELNETLNGTIDRLDAKLNDYERRYNDVLDKLHDLKTKFSENSLKLQDVMKRAIELEVKNELLIKELDEKNVEVDRLNRLVSKNA